MNKIKNLFGISMAMVMMSGFMLALTACADQVPLAPNSFAEQSTYGEVKIVDQELPAAEMEEFFRLGTDYDYDDE